MFCMLAHNVAKDFDSMLICFCRYYREQRMMLEPSAEDINYKFLYHFVFELNWSILLLSTWEACVCERELLVDLLRAIEKFRKSSLFGATVCGLANPFRKQVWSYKWHRRIKHLSRSLRNNHTLWACAACAVCFLLACDVHTAAVEHIVGPSWLLY